jgi:hypothetical protein
MPMTEVGIDRGITRDLYVALGDPVSATAWSVRLHHKPFVNLIWIGCLLMAFGGVLAVLDRRYRRQPQRAREMRRVPPDRRAGRTAGAPGGPAMIQRRRPDEEGLIPLLIFIVLLGLPGVGLSAEAARDCRRR